MFYSQLKGLPAEYTVPAGNVAQVLVVLIVPTVIGMLLRQWSANVGATVELVGSMLGIAVKYAARATPGDSRARCPGR